MKSLKTMCQRFQFGMKDLKMQWQSNCWVFYWCLLFCVVVVRFMSHFKTNSYSLMNVFKCYFIGQKWFTVSLSVCYCWVILHTLPRTHSEHFFPMCLPSLFSYNIVCLMQKNSICRRPVVPMVCVIVSAAVQWLKAIEELCSCLCCSVWSYFTLVTYELFECSPRLMMFCSNSDHKPVLLFPWFKH